MFVEPAGGWANTTNFTARLTNGNTTADNLGQSVAIDGGTIVAGAHGTGYADVFVRPGGGRATTATPNAVLTDSSISGDSGFGKSVAVSGGAVAVGDPASDGIVGLVDVFVKPPGGWASTARPTEALTDSTMSGGAAIQASLGTSVAVSGSTLAAGAPTWRPNTSASEAGAVLEFSEPGGGWGSAGASGHQTAILTPRHQFLRRPGGRNVGGGRWLDHRRRCADVAARTVID